MHLNRVAVAVITASFVATGCGSESTTSEPPTEVQTKTSKASPRAAKPPSSARAQLIECIEGVGFEVTHDDQDAATATNLTVEDDKPQAGWLKAVVILHATKSKAEQSAAQGRADDFDAVALGRAEYVRHAADETEDRVIGTCVADQYGS